MPFTFTFPFFFDPAQSELRAHQSDPSVKPYIDLELTKTGSPTYHYYVPGKIISVDWHEDPFRDEASIVISNADQALSDLDLEDYKVTPYFGLTIAGVNYTEARAPQWVTGQEYQSEAGILTCTIKTVGIMSKLRRDHASIEYTGGGNAKTMVDQILTSQLTPFDHCTAYDVVWHGDTGLSGINLYSPSENFYIGLNAVRFNVVRTLMDLSDSFMRPEKDGKLHVRIPVTSGTNYANTFALDGHRFFWHTRNDKLIIPNHVHVESQKSVDRGEGIPDLVVTYTGDAYDAESYALMPVSYFQTAYGLSSDDEAQAMADGVMANILISELMGAFECPVDFFLQLGHYIKVNDARESGSMVPLIISENETESHTIDDTWILGHSFVLDAATPVRAIKVKLSRQGEDLDRNVILKLYATAGGLPDGDPLATVTFPYESVSVYGGLVLFQFSADLNLDAGTYFFTVETNGGDPDLTVTYFDGDINRCDGNEYQGDLEGNWTSYDSYDINFQVIGTLSSTHVGNVGSIDLHFSSGKYRQVVSLGGFMSGRKILGFTQDYIPQSEQFNFPNWMTPSGSLKGIDGAFAALDLTVYSTPTMGQVYKAITDTEANYTANYETVHDAATGSVWAYSSRSATQYNGPDGSNAFAGVSRIALDYNLGSAVPAAYQDWKVKSAYIRILPKDTAGYTKYRDVDIVIQLGIADHPLFPLTGDEYDKGFYYGDCGSKNTADMTINQYCNIELNATGLAYLEGQLSGHAKFVLRNQSDIDQTILPLDMSERRYEGVTLGQAIPSVAAYARLYLILENPDGLRNHTPGEDLHPDEWLVVSMFVLPHYRTLYLGEYNVWGEDVNGDAAGKMMIIVWDAAEENWVTLFTADANSYYKDAVIDLYDSYDEGGTPVAVIFYNSGTTDIVDFNCFAAVDSQYQPGGLP